MKNLLLNTAAALLLASFGGAFLATDANGVTDDPFLMGFSVLLVCLAAPISVIGLCWNERPRRGEPYDSTHHSARPGKDRG